MQVLQQCADHSRPRFGLRAQGACSIEMVQIHCNYHESAKQYAIRRSGHHQSKQEGIHKCTWCLVQFLLDRHCARPLLNRVNKRTSVTAGPVQRWARCKTAHLIQGCGGQCHKRHGEWPDSLRLLHAEKQIKCSDDVRRLRRTAARHSFSSYRDSPAAPIPLPQPAPRCVMATAEACPLASSAPADPEAPGIPARGGSQVDCSSGAGLTMPWHRMHHACMLLYTQL